MEKQKISITLEDLRTLLDQQKKLVIDKLFGNASYYNAKNTPGHTYSMDIDREKFLELGMGSQYPDDYQTLKRYL